MLPHHVLTEIAIGGYTKRLARDLVPRCLSSYMYQV